MINQRVPQLTEAMSRKWSGGQFRGSHENCGFGKIYARE